MSDRKDLDPAEYAKRLVGTRVDDLVRAAVAGLLEEYRAELARDPAFVLGAAGAMLVNAGIKSLALRHVAPCEDGRFRVHEHTLEGPCIGEMLAPVVARLLASRKENAGG